MQIKKFNIIVPVIVEINGSDSSIVTEAIEDTLKSNFKIDFISFFNSYSIKNSGEIEIVENTKG